MGNISPILIPSMQEAQEINRLLQYPCGERNFEALCVICKNGESGKVQTGASNQAGQDALEAEFQRTRDQLVLAEYAALHSEIEKRLDLRQQLLLGLFVIASTFFSLGVSNVAGSGDILLIYPIITFFLSGLWSHNDRKIGDIGRYIRTQVEEKYQFPGWETYRGSLHTSRQSEKRDDFVHNRWKGAPKFPSLNPFDSSTRGIFLTSQLLALTIGITHCVPTVSNPWTWVVPATLTLADIIATTRTWMLIKHNRQ